MGYSALQIPDFIQLMFQYFKKYLTKRKSVVHIVVQHALKIDVKKALSDNINELATTTNPIHDSLQIIQLELEHISQKVDALEKIALKINGKPENVL